MILKDLWVDGLDDINIEEFKEISTTAELMMLLNSFPDWKCVPGRVLEGMAVVESEYNEVPEYIEVLALIMHSGERYFYTKEIGRKAGRRFGNGNR